MLLVAEFLEIEGRRNGECKEELDSRTCLALYIHLRLRLVMKIFLFQKKSVSFSFAYYEGNFVAHMEVIFLFALGILKDRIKFVLYPRRHLVAPSPQYCLLPSYCMYVFFE